MFEGRAVEAATFYVSLIPDSAIVSMERWGAGELGRAGCVKLARAEARRPRGGCATTAPCGIGFTFTPSLPLFLGCRSEEEIDRIGAALAAGGMFLMPPGSYGFSRKFAWLDDRFGVSWQFNLP